MNDHQKRCPDISPDGVGCGLGEGHRGVHHLIAPPASAAETSDRCRCVPPGSPEATRRGSWTIFTECETHAAQTSITYVNPMHVCAPACGIGAAHYQTSPAPPPATTGELTREAACGDNGDHAAHDCREVAVLRESRDAYAKDYQRIVVEVLACDPLPASTRSDDQLEPPWEVITRVRQERDAAELRATYHEHMVGLERAEKERLERVIEGAPHQYPCKAGLPRNGFTQDYRFPPCLCWNRAAQPPAPAKREKT